MNKRMLFIAGALALAALPALTQTTPTGTISGKVVDPQGLSVPGVTVTAESPALQGTRTVTTSANGDYIFPLLPPGDYTLTYELPGFKTLKQTVRVAAGTSIPLNGAMTVSQVTETVTVVGQASGEFGQTAEAATSFKKDFMEKLPVARNFQQAALMTPGVAESGPSGNMSISGAASFENLFMVNGVVVQDNLRSTPLNLFIEDALQETTTKTSGVSAEFGRFSGGVVSAITKSGGNSLSGPHAVPERPAPRQGHPHVRGDARWADPARPALVLRRRAHARADRSPEHQLHEHRIRPRLRREAL
jgi:hypothetical protein